MRGGSSAHMRMLRGRAWVASLVLVSMVIWEPVARAGEAKPARPIARVEVIPRAAIVGSPMELRITILVSTWFTSAPDYPSFEVAGLIVRRPPNSSHNVRETIDGVAYAGIVREYQLYPQRAATYLLENLVVKVEYANPDTRKPVAVALKLRPIRFEGTIPAPASLLDPFLATSRLVLEQEVLGTVDELEVGDSIKRTITVRARDLPAMFIPPLFPDGASPSGLRAYPQSPVSQDLPVRDSDHTVGRRTESVTYVMEEPGDYTLPELDLRWWNRRTGRIETAEAPAISFQVSVPAVAVGMGDDGPSVAAGGFGDRLMRFTIATAMVLMLIALMVKAFRRPVRRLFLGWAARRRRRAASEPVRFRQLQRLARRGKPHDIYQALAIWLGSIEGPLVSLASLPGRPGCRTFSQAVATLERCLYADAAADEPGWSREVRASFYRELRAARDSILHTSETRVGVDSLPALNPTHLV
jgi:hypothetical protein